MKGLPKLSLNMPHLGTANGAEAKQDKAAEPTGDKAVTKRKAAHSVVGDSKRARLNGGKPTVRLAKSQANVSAKPSAIRANRAGSPESDGGGPPPGFQRLKAPDLKTAMDAVKTGLSVETLMREKVLRDSMPGMAGPASAQRAAATTPLDAKVAQVIAEVKASMDKRVASPSFNRIAMGMYGSSEAKRSAIGVLKQKAAYFSNKLQSVDVQAVASRLQTGLRSMSHQAGKAESLPRQQVAYMGKAITSAALSALEPLKTSLQRASVADVKAMSGRLGNRLVQHYQQSGVSRLAGQLGQKLNQLAKEQKPRVMSGLQAVVQSAQSFANKLGRLMDEPPSTAGQWPVGQYEAFRQHVGGGHDAEHYHGFHSDWHDRP